LQSTIECTSRRGEERRGEIMKDVIIEQGVGESREITERRVVY
jgi:hypothetical protein